MKNTDTIKTEYHGVAVTYDENNDRWTFTLRGRERHADSLMNAKLAIDAPPPKDKKPFTRCKAWYSVGFSATSYTQVEVTSMAESRYNRDAAWIQYPDKSGKPQREKVSLYQLKADTQGNRELIAEILGIDKQLEKLRSAREGFANKLSAFEIPEDVE